MTNSEYNKIYTEIIKLHLMLEEANIQHTFVRRFDGYQIILNDSEGIQICSVIEFSGSFGSSEDKLEIMGLLTDEEREDDTVVGYLSAENVFSRIVSYYDDTN